MCKENHNFCPKDVYECAKYGFVIMSLTSPVNKKSRMQQSVKKVMLTVCWDMKVPITINFREKGTTVNSASYCQFLWQKSSFLLNEPRTKEINRENNGWDRIENI